MKLNFSLFDTLLDKAKSSERLRANYDLRDSVEDQSMRMLNAIEPGAVIPIHRHRDTSEDVVVLRGVVEEVIFDDKGVEVTRYRLVPGSECMACHIPKGQYHTCISLVSGSVIIEFKNGKYDKENTEEFLR